MTPLWTVVAADPVDRDAARDLARRELDKPIYHRDDPSWLERGWERIQEWLNDLFNQVPTPDKGPKGGGVVSVIVIIVLLLVAIALIVWLMRGRRITRSLREPLLADPESTARDHRTEAERLAAEGEWAEAIRERLRAIARDLEERVILDPRPGRTADELAAEAGAELPDHAEELTACVQIFDDVWYGDRLGTPEGYARLRALDERLQASRPRPYGDGESPPGAPPAPDDVWRAPDVWEPSEAAGRRG